MSMSSCLMIFWEIPWDPGHREHITLVLYSLYWASKECRIQHDVCCLVFIVLHDNGSALTFWPWPPIIQVRSAVTGKSMGEAYGVGGQAFTGAGPQCRSCSHRKMERLLTACRAKTQTHTCERKQKGNRMTKRTENRRYIWYYPINVTNAEIRGLGCLYVFN